MTEMVRIGIIGAGGIVRDRHLPGLSRIDSVEVIAVCNRTSESTARIADAYGIRYRLEDWREVIAHPEVNTVLIGTWPYLHRDASVAALQAGKPVFCQARMARNASEARQMRNAQRASGLPAMLCPPP
ncbi:MAG: Gfo/Idh/MocA family oxidoreductase, partial [Candidatus Omnitrophica bacterium]|nr:Gfo/Idh/MocA family oxidoreductase [Candidatus Omnitrophota bacterium]